MKHSREEDDDARITLPLVDEEQKENRQQFQGQYLLDERNRLLTCPRLRTPCNVPPKTITSMSKSDITMIKMHHSRPA